ncbi:NAD(P)H-hydrate epimerase [archaeon]|jgi:NAD(P)H-hydrate epimerase|nr:NAD(P)H-hydrate epimerase [archaeon]MDP6548314.1 NAD(P)H-hydrate epimerase [Candidatus Woesearchaeota archaeon]|tara:strand:+ start:30769 stop:31362 length:594 start_codon:yes stop_codon:yes gene_type:complete
MISTQEMKQLEDNCGISKGVLMENAGRGIAKALQDKFDIKNKKILIVSYHGNNGGDGFAAAGNLCDDAEVDVLFVGDDSKLKEEALTNFKKIENNDKVQILTLEAVDFSDYDIILDAIFGIGINGEIKDPLATLIKNLGKSKAIKVSIDVPSGINPDTGEKANVFFDPDLIITMHDIKKGLEGYKDKTVIVDIGIKN